MRRIALLVAVVIACSGCPALLSALAGAAQVAQTVGSFVDVADDGAQAYFARHPNLDAQRRVDARLATARRALAAYNAAANAVSEAEAGNLPAAKAAALEAYSELRKTLDDIGVLAGTAEGGAECGDCPDPGPLELPTADELGGGTP